MLATAIIVFREVLEAALIVGIVLAATKGVARRGLWVGTGMAGGAAGAVLVAVFAQAIASALAGLGQEVFNAIVLLLAVAMLGWHNVWMSRHARQLAREMTEVGHAVAVGSRPLIALAVVVGVAVLREGSEVVLFLHGIAAGGGAGADQMLAGGALGLGTGVAFGAAMYFGLLRIPTRHLFAVTSWLILLLAAGLAAQAAGNLEQAGLLPALGYRIWDSSEILSERGILGQILHTLVGYHARPAGIQIVFYVATLLIIGGFMRVLGKTPTKQSATSLTAALLAAGLGALVLPGRAPAADLKVYSPIVEGAERALEARGNLAVDSDKSKDGAQNQRYEIELDVTDRWHTALVGELTQAAQGSLRYEATAWENIYQVFEQGEMWADFGLYLEYEVADAPNTPDKFEFKPLLEKSFGPVLVTANPIFEKELGADAEDDLEFEYAFRTKYRWRRYFEPGLEAFGSIGEINNTKSPDRQRHQIGPVAFGAFPLAERIALRYELGWLFGLTDGTADGSFKWLVELESYF